MSRILVRAAMALGAVAATLMGTASPAQAAEPGCTGFSSESTTGGYAAPYTPSYQGDPRCRLDRGDGVGGKNWGVVGLQRNLNRCYHTYFNEDTGWAQYRFAKLDEDGQYGTQTQAALQKVQKFINNVFHAGIATDGNYGPQTRAWFWYWTTAPAKYTWDACFPM